jgi:hypothetical protein
VIPTLQPLKLYCFIESLRIYIRTKVFFLLVSDTNITVKEKWAISSSQNFLLMYQMLHFIFLIILPRILLWVTLHILVLLRDVLNSIRISKPRIPLWDLQRGLLVMLPWCWTLLHFWSINDVNEMRWLGLLMRKLTALFCRYAIKLFQSSHMYNQVHKDYHSPISEPLHEHNNGYHHPFSPCDKNET